MKKFVSFNIILIVSIILWSLTGCYNKEKNKNLNVAIAKAYDQYLYKDQIKYPETPSNKADSLNFLNVQINKWLKSNIIAKQADANLPQDILDDIDKKVMDYQRELLEFAYTSEIVRQKMDTIIVDSTIDRYYEQYISSYLLEEPYLKFVYVKCTKNKYVKEVEKWMTDSIDLYNLEDFCNEELQECHLNPDQWLALRKFKSKLGDIELDMTKVRNRHSVIKIEDDNIYYMIRILDYKDEGTPAPLTLVKEDIRRILISKNKDEFINAFLNELLKKQMDKGNVKILD